MSKLFSCFWQNKKKREYTPQESVRRSRRQSRGNNEVIYVETGSFIDRPKDDGNLHKFNSNVRTVYRTETVSQTPQHEKLFGLDKNGQSRSYPVSPERRPLYKVYSFEQRPSFEKQRIMTRRDSKNVMIYAANVTPNTPQFSQTSENSYTLQYEAPVVSAREYEKESLVSNERPICQAEKPAEGHKGSTPTDMSVSLAVGNDKDGNIQENERYNALRTSKEGNKEYFLRSSDTGNQNLLHLAGNNMTTESRIKTVVRVRPQSSKNISPGNSVKVMAYRAEDVYRSPHKYIIQEKPVRAVNQPLLTAPDRRLLKPSTSVKVKGPSTSTKKDNKRAMLPVRHLPLETVGGFPLTQEGEVIIAAPMMEGGQRNMNAGKTQTSKSILRKETGIEIPYNTREEIDDYYMGDNYSYGSDYGRGNYRQAYYDDYDPYLNSDRSSYGRRGGYYDDPRGEYYDDFRGGYNNSRGGYNDDFRGGYNNSSGGYNDDIPCPTCSGRRGFNRQIYAAQMPEITLPDTSVDKDKNPKFIKADKQVDAPGTCTDNGFCDLKNKKPENTKEKFSKGSALKLTQQTNFKNEMDLICFPSERCFKTSEAPDDPNSKLRWRIIIKKGDEE